MKEGQVSESGEEMADVKKMLFIINPRSGKEQIRPKLVGILDVFTQAG